MVVDLKNRWKQNEYGRNSEDIGINGNANGKSGEETTKKSNSSKAFPSSFLNYKLINILTYLIIQRRKLCNYAAFKFAMLVFHYKKMLVSVYTQKRC